MGRTSYGASLVVKRLAYDSGAVILVKDLHDRSFVDSQMCGIEYCILCSRMNHFKNITASIRAHIKCSIQA
jgi:hypothetical protein